MSDLIEAAIKMIGVFGQEWNLLQAQIITVHTPANTHTQQAGRHTCTQTEDGVLIYACRHTINYTNLYNY